MAETGLTTVGVLETSSIDPLPENSPMETEDLSEEEEAALFCRNLSEDEETENEIPCAQANQELVKKANEQPIETRLKNSDYPATTVEKHLSEVIFADRKKALEHRNKNALKKILPFHALCSAIPHCVAQPQEHTHGEMAPYTELTIPEKHL